MAGFLVVNPRAGDGHPGTERLLERARELGVEAHVLREGEDPATVARDAREARAHILGMAGGDGSLAVVAAVALERQLPFVVVPFGTRNHFARDLGLDRDDPLGALEAFQGRERRIDVGRVGERLFLNNVSLGLYARLVRRREQHRRRSEALAQLRALAIVARRREPLGLSVDGRPITARVVVVANNAYDLDLLSLGERERLDGGRLHLYVPRGLARRDWLDRSGERFEVDAAAGRIAAAVDGEPAELETPVAFRVEPGALRVLVPARAPR